MRAHVLLDCRAQLGLGVLVGHFRAGLGKELGLVPDDVEAPLPATRIRPWPRSPGQSNPSPREVPFERLDRLHRPARRRLATVRGDLHAHEVLHRRQLCAVLALQRRGQALRAPDPFTGPAGPRVRVRPGSPGTGSRTRAARARCRGSRGAPPASGAVAGSSAAAAALPRQASGAGCRRRRSRSRPASKAAACAGRRSDCNLSSRNFGSANRDRLQEGPSLQPLSVAGVRCDCGLGQGE